MLNSILPREGLTLEAIFAPIRLTLLQPLLTGSLLLAIYKPLPPSSAILSQWPIFQLLRGVQSPRLLASLGILFSIGLLRKLNKTLSRLMLNNFVSDKTWNWSREIVIITGGSSGIGALMVKMFAERDITVIILDITPPKSPVPSPKVHFYAVDITSSTAIQTAAVQIRSAHGAPTVLINNAGVGHNDLIFSSTEAQVRLVFDVNTISHFLLTKEFVPDMAAKNHGHVVTVASMASFMVHAQNVDYACSKASALAFHEGLAQELKSRYGADKVRTTVVHPSWIRTPLIKTLTADPKFKDFVLEPETVAEAVVQQVLSGYGAQLILPGRLNLMSGFRGFPSWLQEGMRNGVNQVLKR